MRHLALLIVLAVVVSADNSSPARAVSAGRACLPHWHAVPAPELGLARREAIAPVTAKDGWAVGHIGIGPSVTLIERWNGRRWQRVASANRFPRGTNELHAVSAARPDAVWAVGTQGAHWGVDATSSRL